MRSQNALHGQGLCAAAAMRGVPAGIRRWVMLLVYTSAWQTFAQKVSAPVPPHASFEVASLRLSAPGNNGLTSLSSPQAAHFVATNASLILLLEMAYGVDESQIVGRPGWADSTLYDVSAKPEGSGAITYEQFKPMMQQLLVERLHLVVHRETREMKGYALVIAKGGPKLTAASKDVKGGGVYI